MRSWEVNASITRSVFKAYSNWINQYIHFPPRVSEGAYIISFIERDNKTGKDILFFLPLQKRKRVAGKKRGKNGRKLCYDVKFVKRRSGRRRFFQPMEMKSLRNDDGNNNDNSKNRHHWSDEKK